MSDGNATFTYDQAGRMVSAANGGVTAAYSLNASGQRVRKTIAGVSTYFFYDETGRLMGEYDNGGALIQEIVWLGDMPVASVRPNASGSGVGVFYVHTDHLGAPTKLTRPNDNAIVWRWDRDPFGNGVPNEDPDGNSQTVQFNLRFPGQYFDSETGLSYNYFRDYDAATGRYVESDPIGLGGGLNTYAYSGGNPINFADPLGLKAYSECETAEFLKEARNETMRQQLENHGGLGKFDFSHNEHRDDTFAVNGSTYNASQFGNFLAGYSGAYVEGFAGYVAVITLGIIYNIAEHGRDTDFDRGSVPYIQDGAAVGQYHRDNGPPPAPAPGSPCSCGSK